MCSSGLRGQFAGRQFDHRREDVGFRIRIHAGPRRLAAERSEVRLGEVPFAPGIEQGLDSVEVEKESVAATAGEECVVGRLDDVGLGAERNFGIGDYLLPDRLGRARFGALCQKHAEGLLAVLRLRKHVADRDVRQVVAIGVDVEAVDGVGMERVGIRVCIEDDRSPRRILRRLERVEVAKVESLIAERGAETESSKMIRHICSFLENREFGLSSTRW